VNHHDDEARSLPVQRGFAVQLHAVAEVTQGQWMGRVEHVMSGRATHFQSLGELVAFIAQVLARLDATPSEEGWVMCEGDRHGGGGAAPPVIPAVVRRGGGSMRGEANILLMVAARSG
jgi:hypothetical protein